MQEKNSTYFKYKTDPGKTILSIIIATKNAEKQIDNAIHSLNKQLMQEFELIIVDGAAHDNTCQKVRALRPDARILIEPDNGVYFALNRGIRASTGKWIYVMGADDELADSAVLSDVCATLDESFGIIYGDIISVGIKKQRLIKMLPADDYIRVGMENPPLFHQAVFMRREAIDTVGTFPTQLKIHADYFVMARAFKECGGLYINRTIARFSNTGLSGLTFRRYFRSSWEIIIINLFLGGSLRWIPMSLIKALVRSIIRSARNCIIANFGMVNSL